VLGYSNCIKIILFEYLLPTTAFTKFFTTRQFKHNSIFKGDDIGQPLINSRNGISTKGSKTIPKRLRTANTQSGDGRSIGGQNAIVVFSLKYNAGL